MNDREVSRLIRSLPRTNASPGFTSDVMRSIRRTRASERPQPRRMWQLAAAFAIVTFVLATVQFAVVRNGERQRVAALRAEQQQLAAELQAVKQLAHEAEPVFVLENEDGTRVIMDVDSAVHPASMRQYD